MDNKKDIGKTYNYLTVLDVKKDKNKKYWLCECALCRSKKWIRSDSVTSEKQKSCGCLKQKTQFKAKDLSGQRFGKLIAIENIGKINDSECYYWKCKCDCGNETLVRSDLLLRGGTKSCGCLRIEQALSNEINKKFQEKNIVEHTNLKIISRKNPIKTNTSGYTGISWNNEKQMWVAQIGFQNKNYNLGYFDNKDDAINARKQAENDLFKPIINKYIPKDKKEKRKFPTREEIWERKYQIAKRYYNKNNTLPTSKTEIIEGEKIGSWLNTQKEKYKKDKLSDDKIQKLEQIGMTWENINLRYKHIGEKYNKLTIIDFSHKSDTGQLYYKCQCECGNETFVSINNLKSGAVKSCGCTRKKDKYITEYTYDDEKVNKRSLSALSEGMKLPTTNKSGYRGVYWYEKGKKWGVQITVNKKRKFLGYYQNFY